MAITAQEVNIKTAQEWEDKNGIHAQSVYQVQLDGTNPAYEAANVARTADTGAAPDHEIPTPFVDDWPQNSDLICTKVRPKPRLENGTISEWWDVTVSYEEPEDEAPKQDPTNEAADIWFETRTEEMVLFREQGSGGSEVVNSYGDRFDPPLTRPERIWICHIRRNESSAPLSDIFSYYGTVNDAQVTIAGLDVPRRCAKLERYQPNKKQKNGVTYYEMDIIVALHDYRYGNIHTDYTTAGYGTSYAAGWDAVIQDKGNVYLDSDGNPTNFKDKEGEKADGIAFLDGTGHLLNGNGRANAPNPPVHLAYQSHEEKDFSVLNLPSTF